MTKQLFFRIRVAVLLAVLFGVLAWAYSDWRNRHERLDWARSVSVAVVLVRDGAVDPAATASFCERLVALDRRLDEEANRYRPNATRPFLFTCFGPVEAPASLPLSTDDEGVIAAAKATWARRAFANDVDRAANVPADAFDSRIYVIASPPASTDRESIEGDSEEGGRIGLVRVELDASMVDFALIVTTHELFHTLGATDKYDSSGKTIVPDGLADPTASPLFPQTRADVMARGRPLDEGHDALVTSLNELGVGPATAREIGWLRAP